MNPEQAVLAQAVRLWAMYRPVAWDRDEHLANPTINTSSPAQADFARAVAEYVKATEGLPEETTP